MRICLLLVATVVLATAAGLENVPTDSRLYDDLDLLKTSGLIHSMPSTSRPWTRGECVQLVQEAVASADVARLAPAQRAALKRLEFEFGSELPALPARRPSIRIPVPDLGDAQAGCNLFSRARATQDTQRLSLGVVINNRPDDNFAFYERFELTAWNPQFNEALIPRDSAGRHIPGMRVLPWRNTATLETELAYVAFKIPWFRLELGRDEFVWGPGYTGSVMLDDTAPALDHIQLCANYRNFKFLTFTSLLSRWGLKPRFLAAQRLEVSLWNRLTLGGAMMAVSSWDSLHPEQFGGLINPLIPVYLTTSSSGQHDNLLVGWDAVVYLPRTKVYGQFFMDNWEFNNWKAGPKAAGMQAGVYWAPSLPVEARFEYTRVNAFTYYHRVHWLMYENYLTTMGHPLGPDADQLFTTVNVTPNGWLKVTLAGDYTRRGYYNRGGYERQNFRNPEDTTFLRHHNEFPARGWDTIPDPDTLIEEVDKTLRFSPGFEIRALRDLFVSASVGLWRSRNYQGVIGQKKNGLDVALQVEYRY